MSDWTKEELDAGFEAALRIRAHTDTLSDVAIELACQRNALLKALNDIYGQAVLIVPTDADRFHKNTLRIASNAIARTKGKP